MEHIQVSLQISLEIIFLAVNTKRFMVEMHRVATYCLREKSQLRLPDSNKS